MREGLRSRTRSGKVSGDGEVVSKERVCMKNEALVLDDEGLGEGSSSVEKKGEVECAVKEKFDLDLNVSTSETVDLVENGDNKSCLRDLDFNNEAEADKKGNEGLRSRTRSGKVSSDGEVVHKERDCVKNESLVSGDEGLEKPTSSLEKKGEIECAVKEKCDLDLNVSASENVDLVENGNSDTQSCLRDVDSNIEVEADKKGTEGLRSRTQLGKLSGDGEVVHTERVCEKNQALVLGVEGLGEPTSSVAKKGEVECAVKEKCDFDLNVSANGNVDLVENGNGNIFLRDEDNNIEVEADKNQKEGLIAGRKLRSRSKSRDGKKSDNGGNAGVFSGSNNGEHGGPERIKVKKEQKEADEFLTDGDKNDKVMVKMGGKGKKKLKRKRGRPPKTELQEKDQFVDQPLRKLGRPPKTELQEKNQLVDQPVRKRGRPPKTELKEEDLLVDQSPRKRGRPLKTDRQKRLVTVARKGKARREDGKKVLTVTDSASTDEVDDTRSRRSSSKKLKEKGLSLRKNKLRKVLKTENDGMASPLKSKTVNAPVGKIRKRCEKKQQVRDQIMERLSAAGWTVDYRPRNNKDYIDAVYVGLDGSTHWSITLAYKRLKKHYEAGDGEGKMYKPGYQFTPIPEEDFKLLTRVVTKIRGKNKCVPIEGKGGKRVDGVNGKKKKIKPGSGAGKGKLVKGKMKRKRSLPEEGVRKRHKTQNKTRSGLLVRDAMEEVDSEINGYVPYTGKRTILAWMIDLGTILQNGKVHYMQDRLEKASLEGKITGDGIHCGCCNEVITISDFGAHAGSKQSDPLKNIIYTKEETSLLQCLLDSWNKQDESELNSFHFVDVAGEDPNDDTCGVCGDGGDLICCDGCPSTFHKSCLDIKKFPSGDWHCNYCCCKFCGLVSGSSNQNVINDDFTMPALLTCNLCEEKFHISCIEANDGKIEDSRDALFCGNKCQQLSERLELLLGIKHDIEDGFSWSFIRRSDVGFDASQTKPQMVECNSKLAVALSIMNECFMPYLDHRSGTNLFQSILYSCGSNFKRLNYSGFITAILERGDEIICVASIRIHGNQLAEMPFIGTRYMYRRQGMLRRFLKAIEWALGSLHVELLVIPAISELIETWTSVFGFEPLDQTSKQITKKMNLLVFPHIDMLQKKITEHKISNENLISTEVSNHMKNHKTQDGERSSGSDCCQKIENTISIESGCRHLENSLDNAPDIAGNTIQNSKSPKDVTCQAAVCQTVNENLVVENKSTANAGECVANSCCQLEDKERQCLITSCINTEASEGQYVGTMLEFTENCSNEVKVTIEVGSNNNSAEKSILSGAENIPIDSQIVFRRGESKHSADNNHDLPMISDSCELRFKTDCDQPCTIGSEEMNAESVNGFGSHSISNGDSASGEASLTTSVLMHVESQNITKDLVANCENNSSVVSAPNADEAELCYSNTIELQTNKNPGDCKSIPVSSGVCDKIAKSVNERNEPSGTTDADFLPSDIELLPDDNRDSHSRPNGDSASGEATLTANSLKHLESQNITKDLPVNCDSESSVVRAPNVNESNTDLQTNKNLGVCQSVLVSSNVCENVADDVTGRNEVSSATDADFLAADIEVIPDNKLGSHSTPVGDNASGEAVLTTNVLVHVESQNITKDLSVNCENISGVVSMPIHKNPEDCQSTKIPKIANPL